ncbi:hypothetical protein [Streptomyces sp. NPDC005336]|uniref:hypothetical protein n=1 Tax=unclassified Streptomyces TaxID=2593676 RepID=UPI0033A04B6F
MPDPTARTLESPPRLLPWTSPDGKPCHLASDGGDSYPSRRADEIEALQLRMGTELLDHARALLDARAASSGELRFLASRLTEALRDALRVAESRGGRLPVLTAAEENDPREPT